MSVCSLNRSQSNRVRRSSKNYFGGGSASGLTLILAICIRWLKKVLVIPNPRKTTFLGSLLVALLFLGYAYYGLHHDLYVPHRFHSLVTIVHFHGAAARVIIFYLLAAA